MPAPGRRRRVERRVLFVGLPPARFTLRGGRDADRGARHDGPGQCNIGRLTKIECLR
ncbi:hypothetical protein PSCLAVI8L_280028 [Pseudoclavibacter sp. 8L]|nr:hypothetical protein PSCLAVI8L_280028 [Pseudoclavibacter sp. 8L]